MPTFYTILKAEFYKNLRSKELLIFLVVPFISVFIGFYSWQDTSLAHYESFATSYLDKNPWVFFYNRIFIVNGFLLSFLLIGLVYSNIDNEHTSKTWKYIFSIPRMSKYFLWVKQLTFVTWTFVMLQIQFIVIVLATLILPIVNTDIPFNKFSPLYDILWLIEFKVFIAALPMIAFQTWFNCLINKRILINLLILILSWFSFTKFLPHSSLFAVCLGTFSYNIQKITFTNSFNVMTSTENFALICVVIISLLGFLITPKLIKKLS